MTDPDPVPAAMQEAQWLNGDHLGLDPVSVEPVANVLREVILGPKPENSKASAMSLEAERREPNDLAGAPPMRPSARSAVPPSTDIVRLFRHVRKVQP